MCRKRKLKHMFLYRAQCVLPSSQHGHLPRRTKARYNYNQCTACEQHYHTTSIKLDHNNNFPKSKLIHNNHNNPIFHYVYRTNHDPHFYNNGSNNQFPNDNLRWSSLDSPCTRAILLRFMLG